MSDLVTARVASQADLEAAAALAETERVSVRDERGGRWHLDHDVSGEAALRELQQALAEADELVVVGCIDGVVVGSARAGLSKTATGQLCMIDELIVRPEARGIGVGSRMLEEIEAWARTNDCLAIESQVLPGNRSAKNFFERVGMKTRKMRVSADL